MTSSRTASAPVISAWSAVSGFGIGKAAFAEGFADCRAAAVGLDADKWQVPAQRAALVPGFDVREVLGRKGTRSMDRATGLAVCAVGRLLDDVAGADLPPDGDGVGLVLGTTTGSAQSIMDFTRDSVQGEKPFFVDPARFPNTVMNCAAGQCAIWYQLRGPNATVAGGRLAGLHALNYATRLLRAGRADTVLCGAVEEYSHAREWLTHHSREPDDEPDVLGEGCAVLQVNAQTDDGIADVLHVRFGAFDPGGAEAALTHTIRGALEHAGVESGDVWAVSPSCPPGRLGAAENDGITAALPGVEPQRITTTAVLGDTAAASAGLQIAAVLSVAERSADAAGKLALITAIEGEGTVGCALLRLR